MVLRLDRGNSQLAPTAFHFFKPFIVLAILLMVGTFSYMKLENYDYLDALFMSVITLTTVGYGYIKPLSQAGQIFTIIYLVFGVILFLYLAAEFAHYVFLANFRELLNRRNMEAKLKKVKDHYIICGYGRTGAEIATQLKNNRLDFVIVDKNPEIEILAQELGY